MLAIVIFPNPQPPNPAPNPISLRGSVVSLMIPSALPSNPADPYPTLVAMTVVAIDPNPVNQYAYYIPRAGVDFPTAGSYVLQSRITAEGGILLESSSFTLTTNQDGTFDNTFDVDELFSFDDAGSGSTAVFVLPFQRIVTGWPGWLPRPRRPWC